MEQYYKVVSVEDELPEEGEDQFVITDSGHRAIAHIYGGVMCGNGDKGRFIFNGVTHYLQPVPVPEEQVCAGAILTELQKIDKAINHMDIQRGSYIHSCIVKSINEIQRLITTTNLDNNG